MKIQPLWIVTLVLVLMASMFGCATPKQQQPPPLTQDDIISMAKAGRTDDEIIDEIKKRRTYYRLATKDIINLHENHVSDKVIDYMLQTQEEAIRDEQRRYDSTYYWMHYHDHWYYCPPYVIIRRH